MQLHIIYMELEYSLTPNPTQYWAFWRWSSQPITLLILTNKTVQENTQTKYNSQKNKQRKIQQNKTTLVQLPLTTLGQEKRWANSTMPGSPHGASCMWHQFVYNSITCLRYVSEWTIFCVRGGTVTNNGGAGGFAVTDVSPACVCPPASTQHQLSQTSF